MLRTDNKRAPIGVGQEASQEIRQRWDTADTVEEEYIQKGLIDKPAPGYVCPELTVEALTTPDSYSYTETYTQLLAWFGYSGELLAKVRSRVLQFENMKDIIEAQTRKAQREYAQATKRKINAEELQDQLLTNVEYQEVLHELQKYKQSRIYLEAKVDSIERSLKVVSRQVEIRKLDIEQTKTSANMPTRGREPVTTGVQRGGPPPVVGGSRFG